MKKIIILGGIVSLCNVGMYCAAESTLSLAQQLANHGVPIVYDKRVDTVLDPWIFFQDNYLTTIDYRLDRLPYNEDKNASSYLVIPTLGIVTPIWYGTGMIGEEYKSDSYLSFLTSGVVQFPNGINNINNTGNLIIFGHSSYRTDDLGRYKNIFMSLPLLNKDQEVWVYKKDNHDTFQRVVYTITTSYETTPNDTAILHDSDVRKITLFTCTPIGTAKKRRVVVGVLKKNPVQSPLIQKSTLNKNTNILLTGGHVVDISKITKKIADDALQKLIAKSYDPIDYSLGTLIETWNQAGLGYAGFARGQCTDYAASRRPDIFPNSRKKRPFGGNAKDWLLNAHEAGYKIGTVPMQGAIAVFAPGKGGHKKYGHVAIVEKVGVDGVIEISDMNFSKKNVVTRRIISANLPAGYIY